MRHLSIRAAALATAITAMGALALTSSAALATPTLTAISPKKAPQLTSVAVKLKGTGFSTTPGATSVSFGGQAATSVTCASTTLCTADTPYIFATGPVEVTVTVAASTSNGVPFTVRPYHPPVVRIKTVEGVATFSRTEFTDKYPGIFTFGNIYLNIVNNTATSQTIVGDSIEATVGPGEEEGYNTPVDEASPYVFTITGSPSTLTVKTKTPL